MEAVRLKRLTKSRLKYINTVMATLEDMMKEHRINEDKIREAVRLFLEGIG